jgi:MYXO-CTERM domain-containing protein
MLRRSSLAVLGLSVSAALVGAIAACAAPEPEADPAGAAAVSRSFDRNAVLDDTSLRDSTALTVTDVQKFLDKTPWGTRSALAKYTEGGKSAAEIMVSAATTYKINPLVLLVRAQMEQGLISHATATPAAISIAFGCGCPHSAACTESLRGFSNQATCAAGTLSRSMTRALTATGTTSGWARNKAKLTEDKLTVTPVNAATAALYTYTPWVGEAGGGKVGVGGASLHAAVWDRFAEALSYGAWATSPADKKAADAGALPDAADDAAEPEPDPTPADPVPAPTPDAGKADAGKADAAPPPAHGGGTTTAPSDGSQDDAILGEGSATSSGDPLPPSTRPKPEALPQASEEELAAKAKSQAGCAATGGAGSATGGLLLAGAVALVLARRRRDR